MTMIVVDSCLAAVGRGVTVVSAEREAAEQERIVNSRVEEVVASAAARIPEFSVEERAVNPRQYMFGVDAGRETELAALSEVRGSTVPRVFVAEHRRNVTSTGVRLATSDGGSPHSKPRLHARERMHGGGGLVGSRGQRPPLPTQCRRTARQWPVLQSWVIDQH